MHFLANHYYLSLLAGQTAKLVLALAQHDNVAPWKTLVEDYIVFDNGLKGPFTQAKISTYSRSR